MFRFFFWGTFFFLLSCQHRPPSSTSSKKKNEFSLDFQKNQKKTAQLLTQNAWPFFQYTLRISRKRIPKIKKQLPAEENFPEIRLHGNLHPLQVQGSPEGKIQFLNLEESIRGPWWWDLLRMETGSAFIAFLQNFQNHKIGNCLKSYARTLSQKTPLKVSLAPKKRLQERMLSQNIPSESFESHIEELFQAQLKREPLEIKNYFHPERPHEFAHLVIEDTEKQFWSLKKLRGDCVELHEAEKFYQNKTSPSLCFSGKGAVYTLQKESLPFKANKLDLKNFNTYYDLMVNNKSACSALAKIHAKQWNSKEIQELSLLLNENRNYFFTLVRNFQEEYQLIREAYLKAL